MVELRGDLEAVRHLFQELDMHLATAAILAGSVPGPVYVDDAAQPRSALAWTASRFFLAGEPHNQAFNQAVGRLLVDTVYPQSLAAGQDGFHLHYAQAGWEEELETLLPGKLPLKEWRQAYVCRELRGDWRALVPPEAAMRPVDRALLAEAGLGNMDALVEEMQSERPSVEAFLQGSFGFCLVQEGELAGWCLSEYNTGERCEVGIATVERYRRRGYATAMALALVQHALGHGIVQVGWHCDAHNQGSIATALKAGFEKVADYPVYLALFDEAVNLAVHGDACLRDGRPAEALEWYARALQHEGAPAWAHVGAAMAAAQAGDEEGALRHLNQAVDRGYRNARFLRDAERLRGLHGTAGWEALLARMG